VAQAPSYAGDLAVLVALRGSPERAEALGKALTPGSTEAEELSALLAWRRGDVVGAAARLAAVEARDPWPGFGLAPAYLAAEVATAAGDHREAAAACERFRRFWVKGHWFGWASSRALLLSARARAGLGDRAGARAEVDRLLTRLRRADADLPLLKEARAFRAKL